jgi:hypothetical protein
MIYGDESLMQLILMVQFAQCFDWRQHRQRCSESDHVWTIANLHIDAAVPVQVLVQCVSHA